MQFKPDRRTAEPTGSAACGLHQPVSLGRNCVPLKPLAGSSSQTVPADVDEPVPPGWVNSFALDSMTSQLSVIVCLNFFRSHTTDRLIHGAIQRASLDACVFTPIIQFW